jgi:hypothetical protein
MMGYAAGVSTTRGRMCNKCAGTDPLVLKKRIDELEQRIEDLTRQVLDAASRMPPAFGGGH